MEDQCFAHKETNHLICNKDNLTSFYMAEIVVLNVLKLTSKIKPFCNSRCSFLLALSKSHISCKNNLGKWQLP